MMNGFKDDIVSILKHNMMFHRSSIGLLIGVDSDQRLKELMALLDEASLISTGIESPDRWYITWDYILIPKGKARISTLLKSLSCLNTGGIIIVEITGLNEFFQDKYKNLAIGMNATKVIYEDRSYMILHRGEEYGH